MDDTTCNECGHPLTQDEIERDRCGECGHPYHDETEDSPSERKRRRK